MVHFGACMIMVRVCGVRFVFTFGGAAVLLLGLKTIIWVCNMLVLSNGPCLLGGQLPRATIRVAPCLFFSIFSC